MYQVQRQVCLALLKTGTSIPGISKANGKNGKNGVREESENRL